MFRIFLFFVIITGSVFTTEKQDIIDVLEKYNKAFGEADYSGIIKFFDWPSSFHLKDKTIIASSRLKLKFILK